MSANRCLPATVRGRASARCRARPQGFVPKASGARWARPTFPGASRVPAQATSTQSINDDGVRWRRVAARHTEAGPSRAVPCQLGPGGRAPAVEPSAVHLDTQVPATATLTQGQRIRLCRITGGRWQDAPDGIDPQLASSFDQQGRLLASVPSSRNRSECPRLPGAGYALRQIELKAPARTPATTALAASAHTRVSFPG